MCKKFFVFSVCCIIAAGVTGCKDEPAPEKAVEKKPAVQSYSGSMKKATDSARDISGKISENNQKALEEIK